MLRVLTGSHGESYNILTLSLAFGLLSPVSGASVSARCFLWQPSSFPAPCPRCLRRVGILGPEVILAADQAWALLVVESFQMSPFYLKILFPLYKGRVPKFHPNTILCNCEKTNFSSYFRCSCYLNQLKVFHTLTSSEFLRDAPPGWGNWTSSL